MSTNRPRPPRPVPGMHLTFPNTSSRDTLNRGTDGLHNLLQCSGSAHEFEFEEFENLSLLYFVFKSLPAWLNRCVKAVDGSASNLRPATVRPFLFLTTLYRAGCWKVLSQFKPPFQGHLRQESSWDQRVLSRQVTLAPSSCSWIANRNEQKHHAIQQYF